MPKKTAPRGPAWAICAPRERNVHAPRQRCVAHTARRNGPDSARGGRRHCPTGLQRRSSPHTPVWCMTCTHGIVYSRNVLSGIDFESFLKCFARRRGPDGARGGRRHCPTGLQRRGSPRTPRWCIWDSTNTYFALRQVLPKRPIQDPISIKSPLPDSGGMVPHGHNGRQQRPSPLTTIQHTCRKRSTSLCLPCMICR